MTQTFCRIWTVSRPPGSAGRAAVRCCAETVEAPCAAMTTSASAVIHGNAAPERNRGAFMVREGYTFHLSGAILSSAARPGNLSRRCRVAEQLSFPGGFPCHYRGPCYISPAGQRRFVAMKRYL